jgi:hypothetical protein
MSSRALKLAGVLRWVLDAAWYLLLVGGGLAVLGFIVFLILGGHVQADVPVPFHTQPGASLTGSERGVTLTDLSGTLRTRASSLAAAAILIFVVVGWGLVLFGLRQLRAVIRDALAGVPFTGASARRIELIGLTIVVADLTAGSLVGEETGLGGLAATADVEGVDDIAEAESDRDLGKPRVVQFAAVAGSAGVQELALGGRALPVLDLQVLAKASRIRDRELRKRNEGLLAGGQVQQCLA